MNEEIFFFLFPQFLKNTKWELIANAIIRLYELKVEEQEIIDAAKIVTRRQFRMYGLKNVADEYITQQAMNLLKDEKNIRSMASQALEKKIAKAISEIVDLNIQEISMDDFDKMMYASEYEQKTGEAGEAGEVELIEEVETVEIVEEKVEEAASVETPETVEDIVEVEESIKPEKPKKSKKRVKNES
jgi:hypothetical protein